MTGEAGAGAGDGVREWDARLGWAFGLIAADAEERAEALVRHAEAHTCASPAPSGATTCARG